MRKPVTIHPVRPRIPVRTGWRRLRGQPRARYGAALLLVALLPSLLLPGPARAACSGSYMTFDTASFSAVIGQSKPVTVTVTNQNVNWANDNYIEVRYDLRNPQGQVVRSAVLLGSFGFPGCGTPIAVQGTFSTSGLTVGSYTIQWYIENVQGTGTYSASYGVAVTAPAPSLSSLVPTSVLVGSNGVTRTVNGANFTSQSVVRWNGANRPTTFVSSTALRAAIATSDVATAATTPVARGDPRGNRRFTPMNADLGKKRSVVRTFGCSVVLRDPGSFERSNLRTTEPGNALSFHIGVYRRFRFPSLLAARARAKFNRQFLEAVTEGEGALGEQDDGAGPTG